MGDHKRIKLEEYEDLMTVELRDNPEFREAWRDWLLDRKERHKTVTQGGAMRQLRNLAMWSDPVGVIEQSISNGWTGLFELKHASNGKSLSPGKQPISLSAFEAARSVGRD